MNPRRRTRPVPRRFAVATGALALAGGLFASTGPVAASEQPLTVVRFAAGVGDQPAYAALHVAQWQGFFRDEGLDLEFVVNPGDLQQNLVNGLSEFSTGNSVDTLSARARGLEVIALGTTMRSETLGIMSRAGDALADGEEPIETLAGLVGKTVGVTGIVGNRRLLQALLSLNDIPFKSYCGPGALSCVNDDGDPTDDPTVFAADKVNIQIVGGDTYTKLARGQIDAIGDAPSYRIPPFYNQAFVPPYPVDETSTYHRIEFSSLGAPYSYIGTINVSQAWLETGDNAEIAQKFMRAYTKGLSFARTCRETAVEIFADNSAVRTGTYENPDDSALHPEDLDQWNRTATLSSDAYSDSHGLPRTDKNVWKEQEAFLYANGIITSRVKAADAMSNELSPHKQDVATFTGQDCVQAPPG